LWVVNVARRLIALGLEDQLIMEATKLEKSEIQRLRDSKDQE